MTDYDLCIYCPHCITPIIINIKDINCAIFRHGILKETGKQIDPHTSKNICDALAMEGKIYGCGKPFKLVRKDSISYSAEKCEYI
uniref:Uncharacterized protein n=1 Tax=viral metagenome TaxID=1070528 RepID=A0A6C0LI08_9ZZZZ